MPPPHIALVLADDYPWQLYPRQGTSDPQLPALLPHISQHLVRDGLTLDRHYAYPLCAPARASLLTGARHSTASCMRPWQHSIARRILCSAHVQSW